MLKQKAAAGIVRARGIILILVLACTVWSALSVGRTVINYDLTRYLSEDTMTRKALRVMEEEFGTTEQLRMMFRNLDEASLREVLDTLNARPEILLAAHDPAEGVREAGGETLQLVTLTLDECDPTALVKELRTLFPALQPYETGGSAAVQMDVQNSVAAEIPEVMIISVAIVFLVLMLTSRAWLEPVIVLTVLGISIVINMGTNFIFRDVSFITFSVCAILQLALSIDYAIMLLHAWDDCLAEGKGPEEAMTEALTQCFTRILSSAVTTAAGLLSLLFMSFTIGFDIGLVLSKGIMISMITVFLLMPALVLLLRKPLKATRHRGIPFGGEHLGKVLYRFRRPVAAVLTLVILGGAWLSLHNRYAFTEPDGTASIETENARIGAVFGTSNPLVLLVPGGRTDADYDRQRAVAERLKALRRSNGENAVKEVTAMVTTGAEALKYYTPGDVAQLLGVPEAFAELFFSSKALGSRVRADRLLEAARDFPGAEEKTAALRESLQTARDAFEGPHYARMLTELNVQAHEKDFNETMEKVLDAVRAEYGEDFYVTGGPMSGYDIGNAFRGDLMLVNLITLLAILAVVMASFRSVRLPVMLVLIIEGAIWVSMGISGLMGESIFFISYLICVAIQMGATIDYGILICDQYRTIRRGGTPVREALGEALKKSLPTVLSSGMILITAGYIIGKRCTVFYISNIGALLARGAAVSVLFVLTLLPALLALLDRFVVREK